MKKAFDQTVRDLKRGVNKKVLKVPSIEQKVLDATSNEPWGPHGSLLADIAQASRNYHEYQMIMSVLWKRVNDTGKNWRHVYKALTVLEYLVAHGSERVIDEIREHAYQISTLSDFQYIDSSGKDQGNNVRKKSQSLVVLANDKERIQEVRQKAAANREKYRNTPMGGMYRPGSSPGSGGYGDKYDDDRYESRYGNRDDDRNGYGREREGGSRDDDRYGRYGDSYGREGDKYSRDYEERGRDGYRDDDYQGRGQNNDDYRYGSRSRSADRDRDRTSEDDGQYSSRGSGAKADDHSQDGSSTGKRLDRKYSDQNLGAPPSYEEVVGPTRSPTYSERDGESSQAYAPGASPPACASPSHTNAAAPPPASPSPPASVQSTATHSNKGVDGFDEFDPRGSFSAAPTASNDTVPAPAAGNVEMDFFGSLSDSLALVPTGEPAMSSEANAPDFNSGPTLAAAASTVTSQAFDDPFGDGPFKAFPTTDSAPVQQQIMPSTDSFNANSSQSLDVPQRPATTEFGGSFSDPNAQFMQQELSNPSHDVIDILADILPPSGPSSFVSTQSGYNVPSGQSVSHSGFPQTHQPVPQAQTGQPGGFPTQLGQTSYPLQSEEPISQTGFVGQTTALTYPVQAGQAPQMGFNSQSGPPNHPNPNFYGAYHPQSLSTGQAAPPYMVAPGSTGPVTQNNYLPQMGSQVRPSNLMAPQVSTMPTSIGSSAIVPQPSKDKFETKSTVWADTLSRGLVDLNISGTKTNPLNDIGVDFDAINRRDKRMEKPTTTAVTSTITMGKAMGSGSGIGRAGASALRPPPNAMVGPGMGMGGYGVSQQSMGRGMGMGMGMGMGSNMGMGMGSNMGMGQGMNMQQPAPGYPPASTAPGGYNQMMGTGNYGQQPYGGGGGYR